MQAKVVKPAALRESSVSRRMYVWSLVELELPDWKPA
jgi:hypothetical protein